MGVQFGISQVNSPAPKAWRAFERAYIIVFSPSLSGFLAVLLTDQRALALAGAAIIFSNGIVKAIGVFLGNGQEYTDTEVKPENQS